MEALHMPSLTIKNIPSELCQSLKRAAAAHHRSINGEVIEILTRTLAPGHTSPEEFLARARLLRQRIGLRSPGSDALSRMRAEGRS
jgi:plasmid stability protein